MTYMRTCCVCGDQFDGDLQVWYGVMWDNYDSGHANQCKCPWARYECCSKECIASMANSKEQQKKLAEKANAYYKKRENKLFCHGCERIMKEEEEKITCKDCNRRFCVANECSIWCWCRHEKCHVCVRCCDAIHYPQ